MKSWNPRYVAYSRAHQRGPDEMLAFDRERAPGGHMAPFMIWMSQRWQEWRQANGMKPNEHVPEAGHVEFDAWLEAAIVTRLAFVRVLAAQHAEGMRLIDLLCAGDADEDELPTPEPRARRPQRQPRRQRQETPPRELLRAAVGLDLPDALLVLRVRDLPNLGPAARAAAEAVAADEACDAGPEEFA